MFNLSKEWFLFPIKNNKNKSLILVFFYRSEKKMEYEHHVK